MSWNRSLPSPPPVLPPTRQLHGVYGIVIFHSRNRQGACLLHPTISRQLSRLHGIAAPLRALMRSAEGRWSQIRRSHSSDLLCPLSFPLPFVCCVLRSQVSSVLSARSLQFKGCIYSPREPFHLATRKVAEGQQRIPGLSVLRVQIIG
jgi:hypothetical protein